MSFGQAVEWGNCKVLEHYLWEIGVQFFEIVIYFFVQKKWILPNKTFFEIYLLTDDMSKVIYFYPGLEHEG
jgi:hypothetical protein